MANTPRCPKCGSRDTSLTLKSSVKQGVKIVKQVGKTLLFPTTQWFEMLVEGDSKAPENEYVCNYCGHTWTDSDNRLPKKQQVRQQPVKHSPKKSAPTETVGTFQERQLVKEVLAKCEHREGRVAENSVIRTDPKELRIALQKYGVSLSTSKIASVNTYRGLIDLIISEGQHTQIKPVQQPVVQSTVVKQEPQVQVQPRQEKCPIFVSYKRKDMDTVFNIVREVESRLGVKCWIDLDGIESTEQFEHRICKAIDAAEVVLFMYSQHHLNINFEDDRTLDELNYARKKKKRVLLVKIDDAELVDVFLLRYSCYDGTDIRVAEQKEKMFRDLRKWLGLDEPAKTPAESSASPEQLFHEAMDIFKGEGAKIQGLMAFHKLKQAAESGFPDAMYELAVCYDQGRGIKSSKGKAREWFKKAADAGNVDALVMLGRFYLEEDSEERDEEKALECFLKGIEKGNSKAMYYLGQCYDCGWGVETDPDVAIEWYDKAAALGDTDAADALKKMKR